MSLLCSPSSPVATTLSKLHDAVISNLNDIRTEWTSGNPFELRMENLKAVAGVGGTAASLRPKSTAFTDRKAVVTLNGGDGDDWFFRALNDLFEFGEALDLL